MMKQNIHFIDNKSKQIFDVEVPVPGTGYRISFNIVPQSVSELCHVIEAPGYLRPGGNPEITRKSVRRRCNNMVEERVLMEASKATDRRYREIRYRETKTPYRNETFYRLHADILYHYLDYLLTILTHGALSLAEKDRIILEVLGIHCRPFRLRNEGSGLVIHF
jgi:hypothetical protein